MVESLRKISIVLLVTALGVSCAQTNIPLEHSNPYDAVFDSGGFRIVLWKSSENGELVLNWSNVTHEEFDLSDEKFAVSFKVFSISGKPTTADIEAIQNGDSSVNSTTTQVYPAQTANITSQTKDIANSFNAGTVSTLTSYFIEADYTHTEQGSDNIYSNVVVYDPATEGN